MDTVRLLPAPRLLLIEDDPDLRDTWMSGLERAGFLGAAVEDGDTARAALAREEFDVVILDLQIPRRAGIQVLQAMRADDLDAEVIVVTGRAEVESSVEAVDLEVFDRVTKPVRMAKLVQVVRRAAEHRRLRRENRVLRRAVSRDDVELVTHGSSDAVERLRGMLERAGRASSHVLILGESGSGKELAARSVHRASQRRDLPFLAVNCAAADERLESELFGREEGATTSAVARHHGLLELAHEGTLFLDEVAEMTLAMQAKLLRVLDRGELRRLGGDRMLHVDVRVIAATSTDLTRAVATGEFRRDLFYRLGVVVIEVPPLRARVEDIPLLAEHFAQRAAGPDQRAVKVSAEAMTLLTRHAWPGNVRELRNVMERLTVLSSGSEIAAADVAPHVSTRVPDGETGLPSLGEIDRRHIVKVLRHTGGNRTRAARILGIDPKTLYNKLKSYDLRSA